MYAIWGNIEKARKLFDKMPNIDMVSQNAMISAYAQNATLDEALQLIQEMSQSNLISWNAIIVGYTQNGLFEKSLKMLKQMQYSDVKPNREIYVSILFECVKWELWNRKARDLFVNMPQREVISWTSIIVGYTHNGLVGNALELFKGMKSLSNLFLFV